MMIRLDKYLADAGIGTRNEVKAYIRRQQILVNGVAETNPQRKITAQDEVTFGQKKVIYQEFVTYVFYKPAGYVTARTDKLNPTVMEFFKGCSGKNLSPVGRLDKDTEGLLLITNDGALNHRLMSPSHHVSKTYFALLDRPLPEDAAWRFAAGVDIGDDKPTLPAKLISHEGKDASGGVYVTIQEGRYHQIKRMFSAIGCSVIYLKRISIGGLTLGDLSPGEFRQLSEPELGLLMDGSEICEKS